MKPESLGLIYYWKAMNMILLLLIKGKAAIVPIKL